MKNTITIPVTDYNELFSNIFLSKIFSNLLYHFKSREKAEVIFKKLLNIYRVNYNMVEKADFSDFIIKSNIKSYNTNNGLIIATSHFGYFPFIPFLIAEFFKKSVAIIVLGNKEFYVREIESRYDMKDKAVDVYPLELTSKTSIVQIIKAVKEGHYVLVYSDANYSQPNVKEGNDIVLCHFLGHEIKARAGFCKLSYLTGIPIVFAFMENREDRYQLNISDVIHIGKTDKKDNFRLVTQSFYTELEKYVNNAPEYWFMWNIFDDLIIREKNIINNYILNNETKKMKFDKNNFFCFEYGNKIYIHFVNKFSNVKINHLLLSVIENFLDKYFTMSELRDYVEVKEKSLVPYIEKSIAFLFKEGIILEAEQNSFNIAMSK